MARMKFPRKSRTHPNMSRTPSQTGVSKKTPENVEAFLAVLALPVGSVHKACVTIGVDRRTAYRWKEDDEEFRKRWDAAVEDGIDALESEARRRAYDGVETPIFNKDGEEVGTKVDYSDQLLKLVLQGRRANVYGRKMEVTGPEGGAIQHSVTVTFVKAKQQKD